MLLKTFTLQYLVNRDKYNKMNTNQIQRTLHHYYWFDPSRLDLSTEFANPQGRAYILRQKQPFSIERAKSVVFNVDEIATSGGDFMRCGGDFAIFEIWGTTSVIETYSDVELIPIKLYLCFEIKGFDALSSPRFRNIYDCCEIQLAVCYKMCISCFLVSSSLLLYITLDKAVLCSSDLRKCITEQFTRKGVA